VRDTSSSQVYARSAFVPAEFQDDVDVADCALDDRVEQLHREHAAASRSAEQARLEEDLLKNRDDIHPHVLAQARNQRAAAETRCARLMRAIDALEERLENN
jgi:hypothetical protein